MTPSFYAGQTAPVTGASSGIGAAFALDLAGRGARVVLVARRQDALDAVADRVRQRGADAVVLAADLGPAGAAAALAARLDGAGERVDVLVNNAGFGVRGLFLDGPAETAEAMIALNVTALTALTRHLLPGMVGRGHP